MDASGYSEKGFKRKLAVQALFSKVLYLSEVSTGGSILQIRIGPTVPLNK